MTATVYWQLPSNTDARYGDARLRKRAERLKDDSPPFTEGVSDPRGKAFNYFDYLHQIARAADLSGFNGLHIQHDTDGDESWIIAGYLARSVRHLVLLTEFEASRGSAVYAAKNAVSFQRYTHGRFAWHITRGDDQQARKKQADFLPDEKVNDRIGEFITVAQGVINGTDVNFKGDYFEVLAGGFKGPLAGHPAPQVFLSGNDDASLKLSATQADVHIFSAQAATALHAQREKLEEYARQQSRTLQYALRVNVIARETEQEALFDAERIHTQQQHDGTLQAARISDSLYRLPENHSSGAATQLVGSYEQVIAQLQNWVEAGFQHLILGASPHLEEAYRIGEHVLPALREILSGQQKATA